MFFLRESLIGAAMVEDETDTKYFRMINMIVVVIAVYLRAYELTSDYIAAVSYIFVAVFLVVVVAVPIYIAFKARSKSPDMEKGEIKEPLLIKKVVVVPPAMVEEKGEGRIGPVIGENHIIWKAAKDSGMINMIVVVIAVYLRACELTSDYIAAVSYIFVAVFLVVVVAVPIYIAFKARSKSPDMEKGEIKEPLLIKKVVVVPPAMVEEKGEGRIGPVIGENHIIWKAAKDSGYAPWLSS
ncbi:hypothetical protein COCNU_11G013730 [Cocos nucifera]|uniref:Uncharacterized protein n=1 Tax=Cocos nucifera TaxID=13894 RepID=A0A8K0IQM6_COCNU|nr:hypothetical protein COCNU_11G013730 [Cocos nucifera]